MDQFFFQDLTGSSELLKQFPRTKRMSLHARMGTLWCRARGYDHGKWILKMMDDIIKRRYWLRHRLVTDQIKRTKKP